MLRVRLVGEVEVEIDGDSRKLPPGRPLSLLGWLALHPGLHPRIDLAPRFWPDVLDESARASLRSALWALRRSLGDGALVATRDRVGLAADAWVDVLEADRLRQDGSCDEALALCDGTLLPGLDDDWVVEARDVHRDRTVSVLETLATVADHAGDQRRAVELTRRQAALDPFSEEIQRALMRRLDAAGDRGAALAEYAELRSRLLARVGVGPSPETQALAESLRSGVHRRPRPRSRAGCCAPTEPPSSGATPRSTASEPPGSGSRPAGAPRRSCSLQAKLGSASRAWPHDSQPRRERRARLCSDGACEEQALVPFEPFSEAVGAAAPDREEIESRLTAAAAARPVVLVLDDLHLADRNTLALLARVARGVAGERLLVIGAYRDADAVGTPLLAAIAELRRDCDVVRVPVEGLTVDQVAELLDGAADPRRIHERTDGNPFFVRELSRHLAERHDTAGDVPESISDVVLARVARLSRESAEALTAASVLGECFDLSALELLLGADDLLDALDEASAAGLVDDAASGRYRFAHALTRDAVYGRGLVRRAEPIAARRLRSRACVGSSPGRSWPRSPSTSARAHGRRTAGGRRARRARSRLGARSRRLRAGGDAPDSRAGRAGGLGCRAPPATDANAGIAFARLTHVFDVDG